MSMRIEILGTESLGVRGLCCVVHIEDRCRKLFAALEKPFNPCNGQSHDRISFSETMPHGLSHTPIYRQLPNHEIDDAYTRATALADKVPCCIIDHHLLRCRAGVSWLDGLKSKTHGKIMCAADFMHQTRRFLEADRSQLYADFPVPAGWHESYKQKFVTNNFRI